MMNKINNFVISALLATVGFAAVADKQNAQEAAVGVQPIVPQLPDRIQVSVELPEELQSRFPHLRQLGLKKLCFNGLITTDRDGKPYYNIIYNKKIDYLFKSFYDSSDNNFDSFLDTLKRIFKGRPQEKFGAFQFEEPSYTEEQVYTLMRKETGLTDDIRVIMPIPSQKNQVLELELVKMYEPRDTYTRLDVQQNILNMFIGKQQFQVKSILNRLCIEIDPTMFGGAVYIERSADPEAGTAEYVPLGTNANGKVSLVDGKEYSIKDENGFARSLMFNGETRLSIVPNVNGYVDISFSTYSYDDTKIDFAIDADGHVVVMLPLEEAAGEQEN